MEDRDKAEIALGILKLSVASPEAQKAVSSVLAKVSSATITCFQSIQSELNRQLQEALEEIKSTNSKHLKDLVHIHAEWESEIGSLPPNSVDDWKKWAVRSGLGAEFIRNGEWDFCLLAPYVLGYQLRLKDTRQAKDTPKIARTTDKPRVSEPETCYVTMLQMAAIVGRKKRTLERLKEDGNLPDPDVEGGKGKPHEWLWSTVHPILEKHFDRILPEVFPADQFVRN